LTWCSFVLCGGRSGEDLDACRKVQCPVEYSECFPVMQEGTADCRTVLQCAESCSRFDDDCLHGCFLSGTADAQQAFDVLRDCAEFQCGLPVALSPEPSCLWDRCVIPLAQCAPASFCRPSGGDCAEGFACVPDPMGQFDCFPSTDVPEDGVCQPGKGIACADGTVCMQQAGDEGFRCRRVCSWKGDCPALHECVGEAYEGVANVGTCACKDEDGDGVCVFDDCDDTRSEVYPGAEEICGNSLDDNCDGDTDEGCPGGGDDVHGDQDSAGSGGGSSTSGGRSGGSCSHFPRDGGSAPWWLLVVFMLVALRLRGRASGGPRGNELEGETC